MSIGANPSGITPKVAQQINRANVAQNANNSANRANTTANTAPSTRAAALANANATTALPAAVVAAAAPAATAVGGTTAPSARGAAPAAAPGTPAQAAPVTQAAAMSAFAPFLAMAGAAAVTANSTKTRGISGDQKDSTGDVGRTDADQSEAQPDALQESDTESATDVGAATQMGGPAT